MKIYEIGTTDCYDEFCEESECTLLIATNFLVKKLSNSSNSYIYVKEIASGKKASLMIKNGDVDFIIK